MKSWDYGWNAAYFITANTKYGVHYFGDVVNEKMKLSAIGKIAEKYWYKIPNHFPFVKLDAFVVMPNHIHGIIIIDKPNDGMQNTTTKNTITQNVETQNFASLPSKPSPKNKFGPQSKNLASIVRGYKIGVTKNAKIINPMWKWQERFYDHIIRDEQSFERITNYIINNSKNWGKDKFYGVNKKDVNITND